MKILRNIYLDETAERQWKMETANRGKTASREALGEIIAQAALELPISKQENRTKYKGTTIRVEKETWKKIQQKAKKYNISASELMQRAIYDRIVI